LSGEDLARLALVVLRGACTDSVANDEAVIDPPDTKPKDYAAAIQALAAVSKPVECIATAPDGVLTCTWNSVPDSQRTQFAARAANLASGARRFVATDSKHESVGDDPLVVVYGGPDHQVVPLSILEAMFREYYVLSCGFSVVAHNQLPAGVAGTALGFRFYG